MSVRVPGPGRLLPRGGTPPASPSGDASVTARITGILTPHMVPLDAQGRIDEAELARYVDWLVRSGVHGLYPNGSTGEFL
ncbi:MAG: dihydrodipicolinate synthase family protein, partial [Pirellulales bacterium]